MSIRDLKTFLLIAEGGSFAAAARAIYRTQSAVTSQIQALEEQLGMVLFDRTSRPPRLTEAGQQFILQAREVVHAYDALFRSLNVPDVRGNVRLGVVPSAIIGLVPRVLVLLGERYPGLHIELEMGLSAELVDKTERGQLDVALISDPLEGGAGLKWSPFLMEPLGLIAPMAAPQKSAQELLRDYPYIRYTSQAWVGRLIERSIIEKRLHVREAMMLNTLEAITAMVHAGLGVSIVPLRLVEAPGVPDVRSVKLPGGRIYRTLGLIEPPSHAKVSLTRALLETIYEVIGPLSEAQLMESGGKLHAKPIYIQKNQT